jgi:hypothetical protein
LKILTIAQPKKNKKDKKERMNPVWREFIDLDAKLADLTDSKCISVLLDTIPHDPKTKKIDLNISCEKLQVAFDSGVVLSKQEKDKRKAFLEINLNKSITPFKAPLSPVAFWQQARNL